MTTEPITPCFLSQLDIAYGPRQSLGRFFLAADNAAKVLGIQLSFGTFEELVAVNEANRVSWLPLLSTYRPDCLPQKPGDFCLIGRDATGKVVATHATRVFGIPDSTFKDLAEGMDLFYSDPARMQLPSESCQITAPFAKQISGQVYFGGAAWYHPSFRGKGVGHIIPRISRAVALAHSSIDWVAGIMSDGVIRGGLAQRSGYRNIERAVEFQNQYTGQLKGALTWMSRDELIDDLIEATNALRTQVDSRVA